MERSFVAAGVLALLGVALFVGPMALIGPAQSTYSVNAQAVDPVPDDTEPVALSEVDASYRDDVREAIEQPDDVVVGHRRPSLPEYVSHEGQAYDLSFLVADPGGGGGVLTLASFGLGLVAFAAGAGVAAVGLWRRYSR